MSTINKDNFKEITQKLNLQVDYDFVQERAKLFGVLAKNDEFYIEPLASHSDIYDLIDYSNTDICDAIMDYDVIIVGTLGWAAPLKETEDETIAPSQHPEKRRVRLMLFLTKDGLFNSAVAFRDEGIENSIFEEDGMAGTLYDAIMNTIEYAQAYRMATGGNDE